MKRITLCICMCSPSTSCRFSASLIQNIDKFGAEKYFIVHRTANAIQLFAPIKMKFFGSLLFQSKSQWRRISQGLLDKYSHPFICISLKWILSSGGKPVYTVKILIWDLKSTQITHKNLLLLLHETHNPLHLHVFSFYFLSFFCQPYPKHRQIWSRKIFYSPSNS